jgi:hypothetical protein
MTLSETKTYREWDSIVVNKLLDCFLLDTEELSNRWHSQAKSWLALITQARGRKSVWIQKMVVDSLQSSET